MKKAKAIIVILVFCLLTGGLTAGLLLKAPEDVSEWERRRLAQMPELTRESLMNGDFADDFAAFLSDQLPLRDELRRLKAGVHFNIFRQKDNNGIYVHDGHAGKIDKELSEGSVEHFTDRITNIYDSYLKDTDCDVYYSIIPDKNSFLSQEAGYPSFDYEELMSLVDKELTFMKKIDISDCLSLDNFYYTDTHWKQETIIPVAEKIRLAMGNEGVSSFEKKDVCDFYGVYYGQSALPLDADRIYCLTNEELEGCSVFNYEKNETTGIYNYEKLDSPDRYDIFLSGACAVIEITNPEGESGKELIIFRDSFASSLAPLLLGGYSKVTLVDTRYIAPGLIGNFITAGNQDVLFIYSTLMVNSSLTMK